MPFCRYCGTELAEEAGFCPSCGKPTGIPTSPEDAQETRTRLKEGSVGASSLLQLKEFIMNKKIISLREHYDFQDRSGTKVGEGDGNLIQFPARFAVLDGSGSEVMNVQGKIISLRPQFTFHDSQGNELGVLQKKLLKLIGSEYWVVQNGAEFMRIYGDFTNHDYKMEVNNQPIVLIHKKWVTIRDSFGVSIIGNVDHRLVIGSIIAIEHIEVSQRNRNNYR